MAVAIVSGFGWGKVGQLLLITDGTHFLICELSTRTSDTSWTVTARAYQGNDTSGTMASAALVKLIGIGQATATQGGLLPAPPNDTTKVLRGDGAFGTLLYSSLGSIPASFTPSAHATTHESGGSDAIPLDTLAAPTDITTLNVSTSAHGLIPKLPNDSLQHFKGDGTWNYHAPWKRYNAIRNPQMLVIQRGAGPSAALSASSGYTIDGWLCAINGSSFAIEWSQIKVDIPADTSGNNWYPHVQYAYRVTFSTGKASLAASDYCTIFQTIEGNLAATLKDNPTSISLLVRSNVTGTFCVALRDSADAYSYVTEGTISAANTWTRIALPNIAAFTASGSFPDGTGKAYDLLITPACGNGTGGSGSAVTPANLNSWQNVNAFGCTTQTNFGATTNNTFDFTVVQHEPNPVCTPYVKRNLEDETQLSLRYLCYPVSGVYLGWTHDGSWTYEMGRVTFPVAMRTTPSLTVGASFTVSSGSAGTPALANGSVNALNLYNSAGNWTNPGAWVILTGGFTAEL